MSEFKTSLDEYTAEEIEANGNAAYGGKRHDEICDHLEKVFNFSEDQLVNISVGIWMAIESERRVHEAMREKLFKLNRQNQQLKSELDSVIDSHNWVRATGYKERLKKC